jgi:hypothetical protein
MLVFGDWYITLSNVGSYGAPYMNAVKQALASIGEELLVAYLGSSLYGAYAFNFYSTTGAANYKGCLTMAYQLIGEDKITLKFGQGAGGDGEWYYKNAGFNYIINVLGPTAGRTYTLSADDVKSPSYILLTEDANPANTIKLVPNQVLYPFNN